MTRRAMFVVIWFMVFATAAVCYYAIQAGKPATYHRVELMDR
jgi:hypothetical protein